MSSAEMGVSRLKAKIARASRFRAHLWATILAIFTRGLSTIVFDGSTGKTKAIPAARKIPLPEGPLVVVANHSSHADSAALVAAIGRVRPVLVVSAKDYWNQEATAEWLSAGAIGTFPISRQGDGLAELMRAKNLVLEGVVLVVFPEGTRSHDGKVADFHTGAFRFASEIGATVLPIAIRGTFDVLPRGARFGRHRPINLRLGTPSLIDGTAIDHETERVRAEIVALNELPVEDHPGFGWARVSRIAFSWVGLAVCFFWAFGEGIFWPLIAEMPLLLLIVTVGWRWRGLALIAAACIGSVLGVATTWWLVSHGFNPPSPLTTPRMFEVASEQLRTDLGGAFWHQMLNGIPVKVYAHEAGALPLSLGELALAMIPRIVRITVIGLGGWLLGNFLSRWLRSTLGLVQSVTLALFPFGLWLTVWYWTDL
ncbi:MAG: hypothetical protein RL243_470 [Actinomycetota bacterium]